MIENSMANQEANTKQTEYTFICIKSNLKYIDNFFVQNNWMFDWRSSKKSMLMIVFLALFCDFFLMGVIG